MIPCGELNNAERAWDKPRGAETPEEQAEKGDHRKTEEGAAKAAREASVGICAAEAGEGFRAKGI